VQTGKKSHNSIHKTDTGRIFPATVKITQQR
jgi:hypothetical protein